MFRKKKKTSSDDLIFCSLKPYESIEVLMKLHKQTAVNINEENTQPENHLFTNSMIDINNGVHATAL